VVALGITTDGVKIPLGLWEGSTENATLARTLLSDLVDHRPGAWRTEQVTAGQPTRRCTRERVRDRRRARMAPRSEATSVRMLTATQSPDASISASVVRAMRRYRP
jgi:hypothetical protein